MDKLWGGRFEKQTDEAVEAFTTSLSVDARLWEVDIRGSIAHARMLGKIGVLTPEEADSIITGLQSLREDIASGKVAFDSQAEDIHSEIERLLTERIGAAAGRLHTARSRNDQVATDTRLYLREGIDALCERIQQLQKWLVDTAQSHLHTLLPGCTHLQHAQPVSLAHHLMAYFWMLQRDRERLAGCRKRVNQLPLGSAALAGTSFALDREMVAQELGFEGVCENSMDAVSDRDFVVEFLCCAALVMMHLSRLAEELILWSTPEFGFVELDDSVTTGSSIMPQKKNPDVAELIRGRMGRVVADLTGALVMLKALPLSYNRDLQEDKGFLFDALDTALSSVAMAHLMLSRAQFRVERMRQAVQGDFSNATDLADYLVRKGMPFRQAHEVVGRVVLYCLRQGVALERLSVEELRQFSHLFESDALQVLQPEAVMGARRSRGGAAPEAVSQQIAIARELLGGDTH
ncbi:MAG: argininosuccinate lyase [Armatimonadota bacterium]|nr:argininosuccinate lyase [bacterium]MDW8322369.1 argininosuccinate lyase [Armatimonadota bacterium]